MQATGPGKLVAIAGGERHSLALDSDGQVWAWGYNAWGRLGNGTTISSSTPVQVSDFTGPVGVARGAGQDDIAGGYEYSLALRADLTGAGWGDDQFGQLGDGYANLYPALSLFSL